MSSNVCPVCLTPKTKLTSPGDGSGLEICCRRCGHFKVGWIAAKMFLSKISSAQRASLSSWIRKHEGCEITSRNIQELLDAPTLPVREKAEYLFRHLATKYPNPGETIELSEDISLELQAVASALNHKELLYLMSEFLERAMGLLVSGKPAKVGSGECFKISPEGWDYLDSLRGENSRREIGFHVVH